MTRYFQILGISPGASVAEIKKAYRQKARQYHPDVSKEPDAEEKFIEVNEAYEYLLNRKSGKVFSEQEQTYHKPQQPRKTYQQWAEEEGAKARERARRHAQMKYRTFKNTSYYKNELALEIIGDNLGFYFLLAICVVSPIISISRDSLIGFWLTLVFGLAGIPVWSNALKPESNIRLSLLWSSIIGLLATRTFLILVFAALNLFLYMKVVMHTLIPLSLSFGLLLASIFGGFALVKFYDRIPQNPYTRSLYAYGIVPGLLNLVFVLNFLFSSGPVTETYRYRLITTKTYWGHSNTPSFDETPLLNLEGEAYADYLGIRLLWTGKSLRFGRQVSYHFEEGLFGWRVLKGYEVL